MSDIYFFSGPCGCGKSTLADAYAKHLVNRCGKKQVYVIHGDTFHAGFVETDEKGEFFRDGQPSDELLWQDILKFNWECLLSVAEKAASRGLDVILDYVIEEELPLVAALAKRCGARLHYIVLTASGDAICQRIRQRGDVEMIDRALFLKNKLDNLPENRGHLLDNTDLTPTQEIAQVADERFLVD